MDRTGRANVLGRKAHISKHVTRARAGGGGDAMTWQDIETAPKDGTTYIGAHINERGVNHVQLCAGDWSSRLTHWMPLPAPSAAQEDAHG